jgi:hypothetical protein
MTLLDGEPQTLFDSARCSVPPCRPYTSRRGLGTTSPDQGTYFAGPFHEPQLPGNHFFQIWPANRPDKLWTLGDVLLFINGLSPGYETSVNAHQSPKRNMHGFIREVIVQRRGKSLKGPPFVSIFVTISSTSKLKTLSLFDSISGSSVSCPTCQPLTVPERTPRNGK